MFIALLDSNSIQQHLPLQLLNNVDSWLSGGARFDSQSQRSDGARQVGGARQLT